MVEQAGEWATGDCEQSMRTRAHRVHLMPSAAQMDAHRVVARRVAVARKQLGAAWPGSEERPYAVRRQRVERAAG